MPEKLPGGQNAAMLKKCNLAKKVDKKTFAEKAAPLQERLGELQRQLRDEKIPVVIIVEGWNASGITMSIQELIRFLDPRGCTLFSMGSPSVEEKRHPLMWRFWNRIPAAGRIGIFARGWYSRTLAEEIAGTRLGGPDGPGNPFHQPVRAPACR